MSDILTVTPGTRLRVKGQSYEATGHGALPVEVASVKAQRNRHVKWVCPSRSCAEAGKAKGFGDEAGRWFVRASKSLALDGAAICGRCAAHVTVLDEDLTAGLATETA